MLDRNVFWKMCHPYLEKTLAKWGFRPEAQGQFMREHEQYWDGIEIGLLRGEREFRVLVGIHIPSLYDRCKFIDQWEHRTFEVSHFLGQFREESDRGTCQDFPFVNEWELRERLEQRVVPRLEAWVLPWYRRFHSLSDISREFYELRVKENPNRRLADPGLNPSDAFAWATYGWMLEEMGKRSEAESWLRKAYTEVRRPLYMKDGRFVPEGTKGSKSIRHPEAEERLEELLRQSLGIPVP